MKILHTVEFYYPSIGGMQEVVKQLSERLVKLGHDVTVATTKLFERESNIINGVKIVEFNISGNAVNGYLFGEVEKYRQFLLNSDFDVITNFAAQQWATDLVLPILKQITAKKVFVPTGFSGLYWPRYREYFENMKGWMRDYDLNVFLSNDYRDIYFARENNISNTILIPNGAGEDEFLAECKIDIRKKLGIPDDHFLILHVGSHTGSKGHNEAIKIFQKANIKNSTFLIIANNFGFGCTQKCLLKARVFSFLAGKWDLSGWKNLLISMLRFGFVHNQWLCKKKLLVTTLSREETVAAYLASDLFLFPSSIECSPIVLFECMASKTPFLSSNVGNAAEIVSWSNAGIVLPTKIDHYEGYSKVEIDESVKILEKLYNNPLQRKSMANAGYEAWKNRFTWEIIAKEYEKVYQQLVLGTVNK